MDGGHGSEYLSPVVEMFIIHASFKSVDKQCLLNAETTKDSIFFVSGESMMDISGLLFICEYELDLVTPPQLSERYHFLYLRRMK